MNIYHKNICERIKNNYRNMTDTEQVIADFFLNNKEKQELSAKVLSKQLHVSETALSRFAKKIGFSGYREFVYIYEINFCMPKNGNEGFVQKILDTYENLHQSFNGNIDTTQIEQFCQKLSEANRIYIYALGSSACAACEFKLRFMRLGLWVEVIDTPHLMQMQAVLTSEEDLVIGMSISGESQEVLNALRVAKKRGAEIVLITSNRSRYFQEEFQQILIVPSIEGLSMGDNISPQFPLLILTDIIYSLFNEIDHKYKAALFQDTLTAIQRDGRPM